MTNAEKITLAYTLLKAQEALRGYEPFTDIELDVRKEGKEKVTFTSSFHSIEIAQGIKTALGLVMTNKEYKDNSIRAYMF